MTHFFAQAFDYGTFFCLLFLASSSFLNSISFELYTQLWWDMLRLSGSTHKFCTSLDASAVSGFNFYYFEVDDIKV